MKMSGLGETTSISHISTISAFYRPNSNKESSQQRCSPNTDTDNMTSRDQVVTDSHDNEMERILERLEPRIMAPPQSGDSRILINSGGMKPLTSVSDLLSYHQSNGSQHSFSFVDNVSNRSSPQDESNFHNINTNSRASGSSSPSLRKLELATDRHFTKVRRTIAPILEEDAEQRYLNQRSNNNPSPSPHSSHTNKSSHSVASNQTLITAHVRRNISSTLSKNVTPVAANQPYPLPVQNVVVAESPPIVGGIGVAGNGASHNTIGFTGLSTQQQQQRKPAAARSILGSNTPGSFSTNKRKSPHPMKKESSPSVSESSAALKRRRTPTSETIDVANNMNFTGNRVVQDFKNILPVDIKKINSPHSTNNDDLLLRPISPVVAMDGTVSPHPLVTQSGLPPQAPSQLIKSNPTNAANTNTITTNTTIATNPTLTSITLKSNPTQITKYFTTSSSSSTSNKKQQQLIKTEPTKSTPPTVSTDSSILSSLQIENSQLKSTITTLNNTLQDKIEQLKAVSNNQTIIHSQLRSSLLQREQEYMNLQQELDRRNSMAADIIETLVRKESMREHKELREKIVGNAARLGRWVYNRLGRHSIEPVWEDGDAIKSLKVKREEILARREVLEERLKVGFIVPKAENKGKHLVDEGGDNRNQIDDFSLEREEFNQTIRVHLNELDREFMQLLKEEESLKMEKTIYKRNLKQVTNEDGSRFKHRPKLNDRYVLLSQLGKGGFSEVWRAFDLVDICEVAVKIHQLDPRWSEAKIENYTKHVAREYEIHREVRHPRIVSLFDVFEIDTNSFATVLECCKGTDLDTLLQERKRLPEQHARAILLQILSGMKYLSSSIAGKKPIIHYDLKPGNILFDEFGDAKITDFGLSKIMDSSDPAESMELTSQGAGTYWYLPPECFIDGNVRITNKVDVWSIGVIFYQMLFGRRPFGDGQSQENVLKNHIMLNAREVRFPSEPEVSKECKTFIRRCLEYEQSLRPTIAELCESPYVKRSPSPS